MEQILVDTKTLEKILMVSKNIAVRFGDEAGARVMIGNALRWNVSRIKSHIDGMCGDEEDERK